MAIAMRIAIRITHAAGMAIFMTISVAIVMAVQLRRSAGR
jgi:hypothetical protein